MTLRFAYDVRGETGYFSDIPEMKLPAETMKLAQRIIRPKSGTLDPSMLEDHYPNALMRILRRKQAKRPTPRCRSSLRRKTSSSIWMRSAEALRPSVLLQNPHGGEAPQNLRPDAERGRINVVNQTQDRQRDHRKANKHALAPRSGHAALAVNA